MNNLINRQDVLDVLRNLAFDHIFQCGEYYGEDERQLTIINARKAIDIIEAMPSAKPEIKKGKYMKCNKCKYYDKDNRECYFFSMGSGNPIDMPCYTEEKSSYWKELKINKNMLMCSECGVMFNKNLIYDYTEKNPLVFKFCPCCGSYMENDDG